MNTSSLCFIENIKPLQPFGDISQYHRENSKQLCALSLSTTKWKVCKDLPIPDIPNFKFIGYCQVLDIYSGDFVKSVFAYYSNELDTLIISFAGTTSADDWIANLDFRMSSINGDDKTVKVHASYSKMYDSMRHDILRIIKETMGPETTLVLTGHSLGGAFASLCYLDVNENQLANKSVLYTFGCPRVGNKNFSDKIKGYGNCFRVVNTEDVITKLPFPVMGDNFYSHHGDAITFTLNLESVIDNHVKSYLEHFEDFKDV